jgi:hypothetical protein
MKRGAPLLAALVACSPKASPSGSDASTQSAPTSRLPTPATDNATPVLHEVFDNCAYAGAARVGKDWLLYAGIETLRFSTLREGHLVDSVVPPVQLNDNANYVRRELQVAGPDLARMAVVFGSERMEAMSRSPMKFRILRRSVDGTWDTTNNHTTLPLPFRNGTQLVANTCEGENCAFQFEAIGPSPGELPTFVVDPEHQIYFVDFLSFPSGEVVFFTIAIKGSDSTYHVHVRRGDEAKPAHTLFAENGARRSVPQHVAFSPSDIWVLWGKRLRHFNGTEWLEPLGKVATFYRLNTLGAETIVTTDHGGYVLAKGAEPKDVSERVPGSIDSIAGADLAHAWAIRKDGQLTRVTISGSWQDVPLPSSPPAALLPAPFAPPLKELWVDDDGHAWVMGQQPQGQRLLTTREGIEPMRCTLGPRLADGRVPRGLVSWPPALFPECQMPLLVFRETNDLGASSLPSIVTLLKKQPEFTNQQVKSFTRGGRSYFGVVPPSAAVAEKWQSAFESASLPLLDSVCAKAN